MVTGFDLIGHNRTFQGHWARRVGAYIIDLLFVFAPLWTLLYFNGERAAWVYGVLGGAAIYAYSVGGEAIFRGECGSCHTMDGYRPLRKLLSGRDRANIRSFITMLHEYKPDMPYWRFMTPMVGTKQDVNDLADFLDTKVNPPASNGQAVAQTAQK